jgi:hypothetical protein
MIKQQHQQQQHRHHCRLAKHQVVLAQQVQEVSVQQQPHHQAGLQHLALRHQLDSVGPVRVLGQHNPQALAAVHQLEQERLAVVQAGLEAHLASEARRAALADQLGASAAEE